MLTVALMRGLHARFVELEARRSDWRLGRAEAAEFEAFEAHLEWLKAFPPLVRTIVLIWRRQSAQKG